MFREILKGTFDSHMHEFKTLLKKAYHLPSLKTLMK